MVTFSAPLALALAVPGASKRHSNQDRHGIGGHRALSGASKRLSNRIELGSRRGDRCRISGGDRRKQDALRRGGRPLRRPRRPLRRRNHGRLRVGKRLGDTSNKHCSNTRGTTMFKGEFPAPNPRPPAPGPGPVVTISPTLLNVQSIITLLNPSRSASFWMDLFGSGSGLGWSNSGPDRKVSDGDHLPRCVITQQL